MERDLEELSPADVSEVSDRLRLDGDRALVTGAGNGMGRVVAFVFAAAGADVAISDRLPEDLEDTATELGDAFDVDVSTTAANVADPVAVADMVDAAATDLGGLEILLNVAGMSTVGASRGFESDTWDLVQNVNLRGSFLAAQAAFPHLSPGGRVINVSSIAGLYGSSTMSHYGVAKAGVRNLTRSLANEWSADNVRVNAVAPGPTLTPGAYDVIEDASEAAYDRSHVHREIGSPADVADTMLFLASDLASYVTGETVRVAGKPPVQEDVSAAQH